MYMDKDVFWEYLWVYAENEININKLAKEARPAAARKGHQTRADAINEKEWEKGEEYKDRFEKHRAKASIMSAIEKATNKETKKAEAVLKSVINDLTKEGLNEERVQTDHTFQLLATASDFRNSPLVGEEWSTATLDWRRYVYEQVPTAATHAQDKSVRSSSRRFDSQS